MQYNLTEEQSTKFYNDLKDAVETIDRVHDLAATAVLGWYDDYTNNHNSIFGFKPMSIEKFGKKITLTKGITVNTERSGRRTVFNKDGWSANLRPKTISKLTKNSYLDILGEVNIVSAACLASLSAYREYDEWTAMIHKMENYMQVPYTIDQEWLDVLEGIDSKMYYYRYMLGDKK